MPPGWAGSAAAFTLDTYPTAPAIESLTCMGPSITAADCYAPGDQEHDHQMCQDVATEQAIEQALRYAPPHVADAARGAIHALIVEARAAGRNDGDVTLMDCEVCRTPVVFDREANAWKHACPPFKRAPGAHKITPACAQELPNWMTTADRALNVDTEK
jgi:hypothetical protein